MKLIPEDLIAAIPESVEATRESCMEAADTALVCALPHGRGA